MGERYSADECECVNEPGCEGGNDDECEVGNVGAVGCEVGNVCCEVGNGGCEVGNEWNGGCEVVIAGCAVGNEEVVKDGGFCCIVPAPVGNGRSPNSSNMLKSLVRCVGSD